MPISYGVDITNILKFASNNFGVNSFWDAIKIIVDLGIVSYVVYKLVLLVKETRAWQLIKGILIILFAAKISQYIGLRTTAYILDHAVQYIAIALVVVFQPELRRALEQIGRSKFKNLLMFDEGETHDKCSSIITEVVDSAIELSKTKTGALIVFERQTKIGDVINTGINLDAAITSKLLINIFATNTPLHDGAVVIRGNRIKAAGCFLTLSENPNINKQLGTRHRAAIGITEVSDAVCLIVSEETGKVSLVVGGNLQYGIDKPKLKEYLCKYLVDGKETEHRRSYIWKVIKR